MGQAALPVRSAPMNLSKMIAELTAERNRLDEAIMALERLSVGQARRRGRPPAWLKEHGEHPSAGPEKPSEVHGNASGAKAGH